MASSASHSLKNITTYLPFEACKTALGKSMIVASPSHFVLMVQGIKIEYRFKVGKAASFLLIYSHCFCLLMHVLALMLSSLSFVKELRGVSWDVCCLASSGMKV